MNSQKLESLCTWKFPQQSAVISIHVKFTSKNEMFH